VAMLSKTPSGVNLMSVNQLDLGLRAGYSELAKGGEETRSPVNYVELKNDVSPKKKDGLVRRPAQGGGALGRKTMRVLRKLKRVLENIRADVDRVLSTGMGLKPKSYCGLKMRVGFKWKKARPFHLGADPKSPAGEVLEPGSVVGLGDASTEMAAMAVQGEEAVAEALELMTNGISDVPREGFALVMVYPASSQSMVSADPRQMEGEDAVNEAQAVQGEEAIVEALELPSYGISYVTREGFAHAVASLSSVVKEANRKSSLVSP
jgi:hypothetical protein